MGVIYFNGESSKDYNIEVEEIPGSSIPEREYDFIHVPGRNGDIVIDKGSYKNEEKAYKISSGEYDEPTFSQRAHKIARWLTSTKGYSRLEDSYNPDIYREAIFSGPVNIENILNYGAKADISFNCKPQKFLKRGLVPLIFKNDNLVKRSTGRLNTGESLENYWNATHISVDNDSDIGEGTETDYYFEFESSDPRSSLSQTIDNLIVGNTYTITLKANIASIVYPAESCESYIIPSDSSSASDRIYIFKDVVTNNIWRTFTASFTATTTSYVLRIYGYEMYVTDIMLSAGSNTKWAGASDEMGINPYSGVIINDTINNSDPIIKINSISGTDGFTLIVGDSTVSVNNGDMVDSIYIDSNLQDCYGYSGTTVVNCNSKVLLTNDLFPALKPGYNYFGFGGNISSVEVIPRWWIL